MDKKERVRIIRGPWASIARQRNVDTDMNHCFEYIKDEEKYDWTKMIPKVTYADWVVCLYLQDNKLYRIDFDNCSINEVAVIGVLEYNDHYEPVDAAGNTVLDSELSDYYSPNSCCGEADDMSCYVYFKYVNM
jgi:hypothetical protein